MHTKNTQILSTERLSLWQLETTDALFIYQLLNSPGWLQFIGDRRVYSTQKAAQYIQQSFQKTYENFGFGFYKVVENVSNLPIGICGITQRDFLPMPDLGFAFLPEFYRKGYAFEASQAVLQWCHNHLNIKELGAIVNENNVASIHLLEKLGFTFAHKLQKPDERAFVAFYKNSNLIKS